MRNHNRKLARADGAMVRSLAMALSMLLGAVMIPEVAHARMKLPFICAVDHAVLSADSEQTEQISPYEEFAMSHIPGAVNVAPKPGLPMSQYTSDVGEIEKLVHRDKGSLIILYCNGPFCGKSKRVAADLLKAGYENVQRYQLGIPVWRALGHETQAEGDAIWATLDKDKTAVVIDAREPAAFQAKSLPGARNVRASEVTKAKDDGRLPMLDHNTRIFVIGKDGAEARAAAQEIAKNAFHNVAFFAGSAEELMRSRSSAAATETR